MNLTNHFLVAMPNMDDPMFGGSVVYLCSHGEEGAMGLIVNKPSPIGMEVVFQAAERPTPERFQNSSVLVGGPVQTDRGYVLHTPIGDWQNTLAVTDDTALTTSGDILDALDDAEEVAKILLTIGYASWAPGQLEQELARNDWLTVAADHEILFDLPPQARYAAALDKLGVKPELLMARAGHA